jgi:hypothetical protein
MIPLVQQLGRREGSGEGLGPCFPYFLPSFLAKACTRMVHYLDDTYMLGIRTRQKLHLSLQL